MVMSALDITTHFDKTSQEISYRTDTEESINYPYTCPKAY